jgi:TolB protein
VFDSNRGGNEDLWIVGVDGEGLVRVTEHDARDMQPAWSPKGDRIAFVSDRGGDEEIYVLELASGVLARLTTDGAKDFNPAWAPDGESLVFFREKGDGLDQVYVVRADGTGERRVTDGAHHSFYPSFLPDGRVGFTQVDENKEKQLAWSRVDGSERGIVAGLPVSYARWSPDGGRIAFVAGRWPRSAVHLAAADGSGVLELVN